MGSYSVAAGEIGAHAKTLVANTVDTVTFTDNLRSVEIVSDGAAEIYVTVDGSTPTVGGAGTYYLPAIPCVREIGPVGGQVVKLKSAGTPKYSAAKV